MTKRTKNPDNVKLRDMDVPMVLGYELDRATLTPVRRTVPVRRPGEDYGCDPLGDGRFKMVPSGDIVDAAERARRLDKHEGTPEEMGALVGRVGRRSL